MSPIKTIILNRQKALSNFVIYDRLFLDQIKSHILMLTSLIDYNKLLAYWCKSHPPDCYDVESNIYISKTSNSFYHHDCKNIMYLEIFVRFIKLKFHILSFPKSVLLGVTQFFWISMCFLHTMKFFRYLNNWVYSNECIVDWSKHVYLFCWKYQ